jgi:hypothetical protein
VVDLLVENATEALDFVSVNLGIPVVLVVTTTGKLAPLLSKLELLVLLTNVQFVHTEKKNAVELLVVAAIRRRENVFAKLLGMVVLVVTFLVNLVPEVTISLPLMPKCSMSNVLYALTERQNVVDPLVEIATRRLGNVFVLLDIQEELAVITTAKSELLLTKQEQPAPLTSVHFAHTRKKNVVELLVVLAIEKPETVTVKLLGLVELAVTVMAKLQLQVTLAALRQRP